MLVDVRRSTAVDNFTPPHGAITTRSQAGDLLMAAAYLGTRRRHFAFITTTEPGSKFRSRLDGTDVITREQTHERLGTPKRESI